MQFTLFRTRDPLNHVQRVLGILQRMGFVLHEISAKTDNGDEGSSVRFHYSTARVRTY